MNHHLVKNETKRKQLFLKVVDITHALTHLIWWWPSLCQQWYPPYCQYCPTGSDPNHCLLPWSTCPPVRPRPSCFKIPQRPVRETNFAVMIQATDGPIWDNDSKHAALFQLYMWFVSMCYWVGLMLSDLWLVHSLPRHPSRYNWGSGSLHCYLMSTYNIHPTGSNTQTTQSCIYCQLPLFVRIPLITIVLVFTGSGQSLSWSDARLTGATMSCAPFTTIKLLVLATFYSAS